MLAIGRALMSKPKLLVMDEPSLGSRRYWCKKSAILSKAWKEKGRTILLVEQNANLALKLADQTYVFGTRESILQGKSADIINNPIVKESLSWRHGMLIMRLRKPVSLISRIHRDYGKQFYYFLFLPVFEVITVGML